MSAPVKRPLVLEVAAGSLNRRGLTEDVFTAIADELGVTRPALYHYFDGQQDLVFQSYRRSCDIIEDHLIKAIDAGGDAMEVIMAFLRGMLDEGQSEAAGLTEVAFLDANRSRMIRGRYAAILAAFSDVLTEGMAAGTLRPGSPRLIGHAVIGLVTSAAMTKRRWPTRRFSYSDFVDALQTALERGVAANRMAKPDYEPFDLDRAKPTSGDVFDPRAQLAAKREALLLGASWLFNRKGVSSTSVQDVAERVGVTKKVIYRNVGDKAELVAACYQRSFQFYTEVARWTAEFDGSRLDALSACWHALSEASVREDISPLAPVVGFEPLTPRIIEDSRADVMRLADLYSEIYVAGMTDGSLRRVHERPMVALQARLFRWLPKWVEAFSEEDRKAMGREVAMLLRVGLRPLG